MTKYHENAKTLEEMKLEEEGGGEEEEVVAGSQKDSQKASPGRLKAKSKAFNITSEEVKAVAESVKDLLKLKKSISENFYGQCLVYNLNLANGLPLHNTMDGLLNPNGVITAVCFNTMDVAAISDWVIKSDDMFDVFQTYCCFLSKELFQRYFLF